MNNDHLKHEQPSHSRFQESFFWQYQHFGEAMQIEQGSLLQPTANLKGVELASELIIEEVRKELLPAINLYLTAPTLENMEEVIDGGVDTVYVVMQLFRALGINFDYHWALVHGKNMEKRDLATGLVRKREDGKVLKPEGWTPPEHLPLILMQRNRQEAIKEAAWTPPKTPRDL